MSKYKKLCELNKSFKKTSIDVLEFWFDIKNIKNQDIDGTRIHFDRANNEDYLRHFEGISVNYLKYASEKKIMIKYAITEALDINDGMATSYFLNHRICCFIDMTQNESYQ